MSRYQCIQLSCNSINFNFSRVTKSICAIGINFLRTLPNAHEMIGVKVRNTTFQSGIYLSKVYKHYEALLINHFNIICRQF